MIPLELVNQSNLSALSLCIFLFIIFIVMIAITDGYLVTMPKLFAFITCIMAIGIFVFGILLPVVHYDVPITVCNHNEYTIFDTNENEYYVRDISIMMRVYDGLHTNITYIQYIQPGSKGEIVKIDAPIRCGNITTCGVGI